MSRLPLLPLALAFAGGVALAPWTPPGLAWAAWLAAVAGGAAALALGRAGWATAALLAGTIALGALRAADQPLPPDHVARMRLPRRVALEGRVATEPSRAADGRTHLVLDVARVDGEPRSGRVRLTVYGPPPALAAGQPLALEARLHRASGFRNPGGFDWAARLAREGIHVVASASADRLRPLAAPAPWWPARARRAVVDAMARALPPASAALLAGLVLGERGDLPRDLHEAFRRAGVYHVLAVSGFNVGLVAGAVFAAARLARAGRRTAAALAMAAVLGFALIVGPDPSVLRAAVMAVLVLAALLLGRRAYVGNSLAAAALGILAVRPGDLLDPGFQLSFAATTALVVVPLPRGVLAGALAASAAAQAAVLPITLVHFNQLSTVGVLANLAVVPLAAAATILGLGAAGLATASEVAGTALFDAAWPVLLALRGAVALAAAAPGAVLHLPAPGAAAVAAYAGAVGLGLVWLRLRAERPLAARRAGRAALAVLAVALALGAWPLVRPADGRLRVTVLDVGQGDAIVIEAPDGRTVLIDAGPGGPFRLDVGERVVAPFLWNRGILALAGALVTHEDADHAGGMPAVRRLLRVRGECTPAALAAGPCALGGARLTRLVPRALPPAGRPRRANEASLVLRLDYGRFALLLVGDLEAAGEAALVDAGLPLAATVLKVGHHGARTSTTAGFLDAVRPTVAVISVGARNPYGHPDAGVLARLAAAGARVWRTDRHGAVILETDGRALAVTAWAARVTERLCLAPEAIC